MKMFRNASADCTGLRTAGIALMLLGIILLLWVVPCRFWLAMLGTILLIIGFLLWKFG